MGASQGREYGCGWHTTLVAAIYCLRVPNMLASYTKVTLPGKSSMHLDESLFLGKLQPEKLGD